MSAPISRAIIGNAWRFVHVCEHLTKMFSDGGPIDAESACLILGHENRWWMRDKNDTLFPVSYCPGCGIEMVVALSDLERLGRLDTRAFSSLPEKKGLE